MGMSIKDKKGSCPNLVFHQPIQKPFFHLCTGPATPWSFMEFLRLGQPTFLIPGPMTIMDGCYNGFYNSNQDMVADVVRIIQMEVEMIVLTV